MRATTPTISNQLGSLTFIERLHEKAFSDWILTGKTPAPRTSDRSRQRAVHFLYRVRLLRARAATALSMLRNIQVNDFTLGRRLLRRRHFQILAFLQKVDLPAA